MKGANKGVSDSAAMADIEWRTSVCIIIFKKWKHSVTQLMLKPANLLD